MNRKKYLLLVLTFIIVGILMIGGTYAWLSFGASVNGSVTSNSACFCTNYNYTNADGSSTNIGGNLMQTSVDKNGLSGKVAMSLNTGCNYLSVGYIYIFGG